MVLSLPGLHSVLLCGLYIGGPRRLIFQREVIRHEQDISARRYVLCRSGPGNRLRAGRLFSMCRMDAYISLLSTFRNMLLNAPIGQNLWKRKQPTEMCVMVKHSICKNPKGAFSRIGCESGTFRQTSLRSYKLLKNKSL